MAMGTVVDFRKHVNWPSKAQENCGETNMDRIIGGEFAKLGQYPWLVQLVFQDVNNTKRYQIDCGGSLITDSHVISAAHCINTDQAKL